ncbi:lysin A, protease C39 domain [Gordonia phage Forza]|uniref:Lysin A, protease C39 domain n=1 Tax=Gordonia phage Forza TaxID=2571247 RepID=A0A650F0L6_9CAUD|nr:endolysin [Gordonia phage Forza]QEM41575.1 lysin A, protease C39 domain [Gordonia phage Boopy]QGT55101.1 lysin A, protease C39 domain [Gordonia phage Forza]UXE04249.1 lysin A, protease C39 domain [Gordonia phage BlueNGold]WBF03889.1 lysin A, protease C39 domain [Gordonia phage Mareelih]
MSSTILDFDFIDAELPKLAVPRKLDRESFPYKGVLTHNYYVQNTGYWCGPTTAQMILKSRGVNETQGNLARKLKTDQDGTDYVGLFPPVLNSYLKSAGFTATNSPKKEILWSKVVDSIDAGYGVVANIVARTYNRPSGYPNYTVWHYVPIFGYETKGTTRRIFCADSANFSGVKSWWAPLDQMTSLVSEKGIAPAKAGKKLTYGLDEKQLAEAAINFRQLGPS